MKKFFSLIAAVLFAGSMMAETYTLTAFADISSGDEVIITMTNATAMYAMSNDNGTSSAPAAVAVESVNNAITTDATNIVWSYITDGTNFAFQPKGDNTKWLYCTNTNNGVRVGTNETNSAFSIDATNGYMVNNETSRFIGVYNNQDWRCYTTVNNNIKEQTLAFYVKSGEVVPPTPEPVAEYYLVGNFNGWQALEAYKLVVNPGNAEEMMISGVQLAADDSIKVLGIQGETTTWYPDNAANYVIAADGEYDIYFRADGQGGDDWYYHYFYVAEVVAPVTSLYTCAQVQANEATEAGELNEVQVLFINGGQFYVRDASGMTLIYKSNHGLRVGDFVSGIVGTSTIYNNTTPQFQPSNAPADWTIIVTGDAPVYDEKTEAPVVTDINGVYNFKNVSFSEAVEFTTAAKGTAVTATIGEGTIAIFNNYKKAFSFEAEKAYDITGVVTIYQNNPQIYFISATEHVATAIDNTNAAVKATKVIENGKLVIIKNGVRYNAQGTRL